ncbi:lipopolysaccharide biosynthesis protein [Microbacteriaceae bacterium VKM Ac-2855]|nr:lipopolysaccharide biosynthesis protein [Microbacteriaceae bacterium VKM Ac-2855]
MGRIRSLLNSPIAMLASRLSVAALGLVSAPLIAQSLGPSGRGETAASLAAMYLIPIVLAFGMPFETRRRVLESSDLGAVRTARRLAVLAVIPAALIAWLVTSTLLVTLDDDAKIAAFVGITSAPLMVSWMVDIGVVGAHRRFGAVALLQATQPIVYVGGVFALFLFGHISVAGVIWSNLAGSAVTAVVGWCINRTSGSTATPWRPLFRGSLTFYGAQASDAAYQRLDQVIMLPLIGAHQAGLYSVAVTIGTLPVFLAHAVAAPVFADVSEASEAGRMRAVGDALRSAFVVGIVAAVFLGIASYWGVPFLFGAEFAEALPAVYIAIIGSIFLVVAVSGVEVLSAGNKGFRLTTAQVVGLIVCLSVLLTFGPSGGAIAAAIANAGGIVVALIVMIFAIRPSVRHLVPRPSDVGLVVRRLTSRGGSA